MDFWQQIDARRARWDVLAHPFYQRWSSGELRRPELANYASEYVHAVEAIAVASKRAATLCGGGALDSHAAEEDDHIGLWLSFAKATGWGCRSAWFFGEDPMPATVDCGATWAGGAERSLPEHLVTLYAIESAQPDISALKLTGLLDHYGFDEGAPTEYFRLHSTLDHGHARMMRAQLEPLLDSIDRESLLDQAEAVHRSYWALLDDVEVLGTN